MYLKITHSHLLRVMQSLNLGRGFVYSDYKPQWRYEPPFSVEKLFVRVFLDLENRRVMGLTINDILLNENVPQIKFDAVDMDIKRVLVEGRETEYSYDGKELIVFLGEKGGKGEKLRVEIHYELVNPRKGIWFVPVDREEEPASQVWTQGETEYNRYWIPSYDYPHMKMPVDLEIKIRKDKYVFANGELVEKVTEGDFTVWRYRFGEKIPLYLVAFAAGDFHVEEEKYGDVLLQYVVPRGQEEKLRLSFEKTPKMMKFFEEFTGVKYPYPKYTQVCVDEFIFGGMENASLTILTSLTLHDEKAHVEFRSEPLVSHELAHQWFGDLVTCKDWSHIWLNEGFATFMQAMWRRHDEGEEEFIYDMIGKLDAYLSEYGRYSRPVVLRLYRYPLELFDSHSYSKGALILWSLMNMVGEKVFREAVKRYLEKHSGGNADTEDLRKAFESVYGGDLEWFFQQYVYSSGHPVLKYSYKWNSEGKVLEIKLTQEEGKDRLDAYRLRLDVSIKGDCYEKNLRVELDSKEKILTLALPSKPKAVCVDPDFKVFAELKPEVDAEKLASMLEHCGKLYPKILALRTLANKGSTRHIEKIAGYLLDEKQFWGLRVEAAKAIAKIGGVVAKKTLLDALKTVKNPKVRAQIVSSLAGFKDPELADVFIEIFRNTDESYRTRAEAVKALAKTKHGKAFEIALKALDTPSHADIIKRAGIEALAELGTEDARRIIETYTSPDNSPLIRSTALIALSRFRVDGKMLEVFRDAIKSRHIRVLRSIASAAKNALDPRFLPLLAELRKEPEVYRVAREVEETIRKHMEKGEEYRKLREEVEKIRAEEKSLFERIERLEQKMSS